MVQEISVTDTANTSGFIGVGGFNAYGYYDDIRVRKFTTTEPSFSSAGAAASGLGGVSGVGGLGVSF